MKAVSQLFGLPVPMRLGLALLLFLMGLIARGADAAASRNESPGLPVFVGFLGSANGESRFALKWTAASGAVLQAWLRIGQQAGDFKLVSFDPAAGLLTIEDASGRRFDLGLPDGKVQGKLSEEEFAGLMKFMLHGADTTDAPVLSREKARAFFLRMIERFNPPGADVILDLTGSSLPPSRRATWESDQARARSFDRLLLVTVTDGNSMTHDFPRKPFIAPEPMIRNLIDSDWDEFALLQAMSTLKSKARTPRQR